MDKTSLNMFGLLQKKDKEWRTARNTISPTFSASKLKAVSAYLQTDSMAHSWLVQFVLLGGLPCNLLLVGMAKMLLGWVKKTNLPLADSTEVGKILRYTQNFTTNCLIIAIGSLLNMFIAFCKHISLV